ncbi:hypothetical protein C0J52_04824 [Blattella germanica]|nr:hypothetical protein C0J52_04824 [Blattella germanica]
MISNTLVDLIKEVEEVLPEQANSTFRLLKGVKETTTELQTSILHDFRIVLYRLQENLTQASGMKMPHPMMAPADWEQGVRSHDEPLSTELKADLEKVTDVLTKFQNYAQLLIAPFIKTLGLDTMKANVTVPIDLFNSSNATLALNQTTKLLKVAGKLLETSRKVEDLKKVTGSVEKEPYSSTPSVV